MMTYNKCESRCSQKTRIFRREKTENSIRCFIDPHCSRSDDKEHCNLQVDGEQENDLLRLSLGEPR